MKYCSLQNSILLFLCLMIPFLQSCTPKNVAPKERTAEYIDDIGDVYLTPGQPILLDDELKKKLSPNFTLTGDQAILKSLPQTAIAQKYLLDRFLLSLGIAGPVVTNTTSRQSNSADTSTILSEVKKTLNSDGANQSTSSDTQNTSSSNTGSESATKGKSIGDASTLKIPSADDLGKIGQDVNLPELLGGALGVDYSLALSNAQHLFTSAQIINETLNQLKAPNDNWAVYILPLKVTLIPNGANLPYNLRSTITFSGVRHDKSKTGPVLATEEIDDTNVKVLTLGTDNHELMLSSAAQDYARALGLGAKFTAGVTNLNAGIGAESNSGNNFKLNEINSILTAGQNGQTIINVHFGAVKTSDTTYQAVPRTYLMVLIVMLPKTAEELFITSSNKFVHAMNGGEITRTKGGESDDAMENILSRYINDKKKLRDYLCECPHISNKSDMRSCTDAFNKKFNINEEVEDGVLPKADKVNQKLKAELTGYQKGIIKNRYLRVRQLAHYGRQAALAQCLGYSEEPLPKDSCEMEPKLSNSGFTIQSLTASINSLDDGKYSKALVTLPLGYKNNIVPKKLVLKLPTDQTAILLDDTKQLTTYLLGGENLKAEKKLSAFIEIGDIKIGASSIKSNENSIELTFPSISDFAKKLAAKPIALELLSPESEEKKRQYRTYHRVLPPEKKTEPQQAKKADLKNCVLINDCKQSACNLKCTAD